MDKQTETRELVNRLVGDLQPVKPLRLARLYAACLLVQLGVGFVASWYLGFRADLTERLDDASFLIIVGSLVLSAAVCTIVAARSAVPGLGVKRGISAALVMVPLILAASVALSSPWGGVWQGWAVLLKGGHMCMQKIALVAVLPWFIMLAVLRKAAPLREYATGMFIGLASFLIGATVVELACDVTDHYHLMFAHYLPVTLGAVVVASISAAALRSRAVQGPRDKQA